MKRQVRTAENVQKHVKMRAKTNRCKKITTDGVNNFRFFFNL